MIEAPISVMADMKILITDDHALFREGVRQFLISQDAKIQVLEASNAAGALQLLASHAEVRLLLLDLAMPDNNGLTLLKRVRTDYPQLIVVMLSASESPADIRTALDLGASGYIPKSAVRNLVWHAIQVVLAGGIYLPAAAIQPIPQTDARGTTPLTPRQQEVLALLGAGKSNKGIATELGVSEGTVKQHVKAILCTLRAKNRTQAAFLANKA